MINNLTEDTKATILLCGHLSKNQQDKSLSLGEYAQVVRWLMEQKLRPADLLNKENIENASSGSGVEKQRLENLLGRGVQLGFAIEEWQRNGIWIISRSDNEYPIRYKNHLKHRAPPILFGVGNRALLRGGGLAIVGSRRVDQIGENFTRHIAETCASNNISVISGGARGVDQTAIDTVLENGGSSIVVLAEKLLQKSVEKRYLKAINEGRVVLLSPYHPNINFRVENAMGRNKLIYAISDYALVVSAEYKKGGTWNGAEEELKRENSLPVFARMGHDVPLGNQKLLDFGAISWLDCANDNEFSLHLEKLSNQFQNSKTDKSPTLFDLTTPVETSPTMGY